MSDTPVEWLSLVCIRESLNVYLETNCVDFSFFVLFIDPSGQRSVHLKLDCDHILSNSPFTVEKVVK
jgi:hypothetical protein